MKKTFLAIALLVTLSCKEKPAETDTTQKLNELATNYLKLGLAIGQYDADFVDAYYGPDSLKPKGGKQSTFPKDSLLKAASDLKKDFQAFSADEKNDTLKQRAKWMVKQLIAYERRIKIFSGEFASFDEESKELFDAVAPAYPESYYSALVQRLDSLLPGKGAIPERFQQLANKFIIPKNKLDTVLKVSIAECRKRTMEHFALPSTETFELEYVTNKPWSGYNWYKGNYKSVIQINTDLNIFIDRAIDVGSHESYPGHHVYNMLFEKNLYNNKKLIEVSMYPLFSPQSLIAEGSANYGIEVVFPGDEKIKFAKEILLPLAGLDTSGISLYFNALHLKGDLNFARNEVGRGLINGTMNEQEALRWLEEYCLNNDETARKGISFIRAMRSYIINYNYGQELVKNYIESKGGTADARAKRWELFDWLLSTELMPSDLQKAN